MDNDVLRRAPLFSALDDEAATALRASMGETRLRRGEVLFHEGAEGDKLYIVTDGQGKPGRFRRRACAEPRGGTGQARGGAAPRRAAW